MGRLPAVPPADGATPTYRVRCDLCGATASVRDSADLPLDWSAAPMLGRVLYFCEQHPPPPTPVRRGGPRRRTRPSS